MLLTIDNYKTKYGSCFVNNSQAPKTSKEINKQNLNSVYYNGDLSRKFAANFKGQVISFNGSLRSKVKEAFEHLEKNIGELKTIPPGLSLSEDQREIIIPGHVELANQLTVLAQAFPGLLQCVTKLDHRNGSVATHLLKTFKYLIEDEEYQNLDKDEKLTIKIATLFHDIAKNEIGGKAILLILKIRQMKFINYVKSLDFLKH